MRATLIWLGVTGALLLASLLVNPHGGLPALVVVVLLALCLTFIVRVILCK